MTEFENISNPLETYNHISADIEETYGAAARYFGLSDTRMMILYILLTVPSASQADMTRCSGLPKQTINTCLKNMEKENLLILKQGTARKKEIQFTDAGQKLAENTAGKVILAEKNTFKRLGKENSQKLLALTNLYQKYLKEELEEVENDHQTV